MQGSQDLYPVGKKQSVANIKKDSFQFSGHAPIVAARITTLFSSGMPALTNRALLTDFPRKKGYYLSFSGSNACAHAPAY
jgi:hypothetical protein